MTIGRDNRSKLSEPPIAELSHPEITKFRQSTKGLSVAPEIEKLDSMSPDELKSIIHKQQITINKLEDSYRKLCDFAPVGYVIIDEQGVIIESNHTFSTLIGTAEHCPINEKLVRFTFKNDRKDYQLFHDKQEKKRV